MIVMIALFGATLVAQPALMMIAQEGAVEVVGKQDTANKNGPNRLICRTNDAIGSRLERERRCYTSSEWKELRQLDRRAIDKIQANRYNGNCTRLAGDNDWGLAKEGDRLISYCVYLPTIVELVRCLLPNCSPPLRLSCYPAP